MGLTDKVSQMAKKREQLYADYVAGVVDSEDYQLIREDYSRQYDGLRAALQEAENKKVQVEQQIEEYLNMTSHLEEHLDNFEFDIQLVKSLVQKIGFGLFSDFGMCLQNLERRVQKHDCSVSAHFKG